MKSSLSILILCKSLPWRFNGGIQTHVWDLSKTLVSKGQKVTILTGGAWRSRIKTLQKDGVEIVEIPFFPGRHLPLFSYLAEEFSFNVEAKNWVKANCDRFDIIHAQGRSGYLLYSIPSLLPKLVQTVHGLTQRESDSFTSASINHKSHSFFAQRWERKLMASSREVIAVSEDLKSNLGSEKVKVIPNGVSLSLPRLGKVESSSEKFVFVGRLSPIKGLLPLIKAMAHHTERLELDIIGDGPQQDEIKKLIQNLGLADRVKLLGALSNEEVHGLLPNYRALVLPSSYETQGIVLLEANYQGLPVIASDLASIRESVKHGDNGLLCNVENPHSFILAMKKLKAKPELAREMGQRGKDRVLREFSWDHIADTTLALYQKIAS